MSLSPSPIPASKPNFLIKSKTFLLFASFAGRRAVRSRSTRAIRLLRRNCFALGSTTCRYRHCTFTTQMCQIGSRTLRASLGPLRRYSQTQHHSIQQLRVIIGLRLGWTAPCAEHPMNHHIFNYKILCFFMFLEAFSAISFIYFCLFHLIIYLWR